MPVHRCRVLPAPPVRGAGDEFRGTRRPRCRVPPLLRHVPLQYVAGASSPSDRPTRGPAMRSFLVVVLLVAAASAVAAPATQTGAAWRSDLDTLRRELPIRHPAPFLNVPRA